MDSIHKQEFRVRDLPTRSVSLFPTQAQVVRDIKDVTLRPGVNQITVVGFTPTSDENSFKVEGTGSAVISDISVELLPNRELFHELYPDSDSDADEADADSDADGDAEEPKKESAELKEVRGRLTELRDAEKVAREAIASAETRLQILDSYGKVLDREWSVGIDEGLERYRAERAKIFADHVRGEQQLRRLVQTTAAVADEERVLLRQQAREERRAERALQKAERAEKKAWEREAMRQDERRRERQRVREERQKLWPRRCYSVRITLDAAGCTPASSRRTSVASVAEGGVGGVGAVGGVGGSAAVDDAAALTCDLAVSYVTTSAFWAPTYDLQLSTTTGAAVLCFDANLTNTTSETWSSCRVVLSTSQTALSGLHDAIPVLQPWRVKLAKTGTGTGTRADGPGLDRIVSSREELAHRSGLLGSHAAGQAASNSQPRHELFGVSGQSGSSTFVSKRERQQRARRRLEEATQSLQKGKDVQSEAGSGPVGGAGNAARPSPAFGSAGPAIFSFGPAAPRPGPAMACRRLPTAAERGTVPGRGRSQLQEKDGDGDGDGDEDVDADDAGTPELDFQESAQEETGLTTTYDLPGLKTLASSAAASRQRVARVGLPAGAVVFSHTVVAKYRPAAYLQARIRNTSRLTLLRGPAGLTLDGAFLGRVTLPRCSAGDAFPLSLGVDPAVRVAYPKPDVRRAAAGGSLFSKETSAAFRRSVTVTNTRAAAARPTSLLVLDQVPVSEDEKLRVDIQLPRGLAVDGPAVAAGQGVAAGTASSSSSPASSDWGHAVASLKKAGQVTWDVQLNAGRTVRLDLEYSVTVPVGEGAMQC